MRTALKSGSERKPPACSWRRISMAKQLPMVKMRVAREISGSGATVMRRPRRALAQLRLSGLPLMRASLLDSADEENALRCAGNDRSTQAVFEDEFTRVMGALWNMNKSIDNPALRRE